MEDQINVQVLTEKIRLLGMLITRECECDRSRCAEHFRYLQKLKYEYELQLEALCGQN